MSALLADGRLSGNEQPAVCRFDDSSGRLVYVDRLRVFAVAGVFLIHVAEVFNPWDEWHITSLERSRVAGEIVVVMAPWIMPLFMLLAGVSAYYSLGKRGNGEYLAERTKRVLLPLVIGILVLVPPQVYLERRLNGQFSGSFIDFYPHFFDGLYPKGNFSWHHLWFLAHLFLYSIITLPLFRFLRHERGERLLEWTSRLVSSPHGLLWLSLPLILERIVVWETFTQRHILTSDWSNSGLLIVAYIYGFVLAASPSLGRAIDAQLRWSATAAVIAIAAFVIATWNGILPARMPGPNTWQYVVFWSLYAVVAWTLVVTMLGLGRKWLSREGPELDFGRAIGYQWYLLHQTMIVAAAYWIVRWRVGLLEQFVAIFAIAACGTYAGIKLWQLVASVVRNSLPNAKVLHEKGANPPLVFRS